MWHTNIKEKVVIPISKKAIESYADKAIESESFKVEIDGYETELIYNNILKNNFFKENMLPEQMKEATDMINVMVMVADRRWFVEVYYKINNQWIREET